MPKNKIIGKKIEHDSDIKHARAHKKGAVVELVQTALDRKWGEYMFSYYFRHTLLLKQSAHNYTMTMKYLGLCREINPDSKNIRYLKNNIKEKLEKYSILYLITTKLSIEYLVVEIIERINNTEILHNNKKPFSYRGDTVQGLKDVKTFLTSNSSIPQELYDLIERRDIVEHPKKENLLNNDKNAWKNVHLSWVLSGEIEEMMIEVVGTINQILLHFENYIKDNATPGELTGVVRGVYSKHQPKLSK